MKCVSDGGPNVTCNVPFPVLLIVKGFDEILPTLNGPKSTVVDDRLNCGVPTLPVTLIVLGDVVPLLVTMIELLKFPPFAVLKVTLNESTWPAGTVTGKLPGAGRPVNPNGLAGLLILEITNAS